MKEIVLLLFVLAIVIIAGCVQPPPEGCPDITREVCGKDGKTYKNPCFLQKAGIEPDYVGECTKPTDTNNQPTAQTCESGTEIEGEKILVGEEDLVCRKLYQFEYTLEGLTNESFQQSCEDSKYLAESEKQIRPWFKQEGNKYVEQMFTAVIPAEKSWTFRKVQRDVSIDKEGYFQRIGFPNVKVKELKIFELKNIITDNSMYKEADKIICQKASEQEDVCGDGICSGDEVGLGHGCMREVCLTECPQDCKELSEGTVYGKCTEEYEPVCGKDGITYRNSCEFSKSETELDHFGEC